MKKQTNKKRIIDALNAELENIYHNATIRQWPDDIPGCPAFFDWLGDAGSYEVSYLNDGGATGRACYTTFEHIKREAAAFKSDAARARFLRMKRRDYLRDRAAGIESRIHEYGRIYSYGRGGRTLAPDNWTRPRGGSGFSAKQYDYEDLTAERAADILRDVREFNAFIRAWCDYTPKQYREECAYRLSETIDEKRDELHALNREALPLIREIKAAGRAFSPSVCKVLTDELKKRLRARRSLINEIQSALATLSEVRPCAN